MRVGRKRLLGLVGLLGGLAVLAGCEQPTPAARVLTITASPSTSLASPTARPNYKEVAGTQLARDLQAIRTSVVLTAAPTWTLGPPPVSPSATPAAPVTPTGPELDATKNAVYEVEQHQRETAVALAPPDAGTVVAIPTPEPVLTPILGFSGDCAQGNHEFYHEGCWAGVVDNEYLFVQTGALMADPDYGVVRVYTATLNLVILGADQDYRTPSQAGRLRPVQLNWPVMTLVVLGSNPPAYFGFDLSSRQWVTAPPLPSPSPGQSPLPSPVPSVTP
jgi:hypothetical protein